MAHEIYSPVGYAFDADQYCLACIPDVLLGDKLCSYIQEDGDNCTECVLDRAGDDRGIDRHDESSFDMSDFPKSIAYHNDLHYECEPDCCNDRCAKCGAVIDGITTLDRGEICPNAKETNNA